MAEHEGTEVNSARRRQRTILAYASAALLTGALLTHTALLAPFLAGHPLAKSTSPDHNCTVYIRDASEGFLSYPSPLLASGQHVFVWKRWHFLPREVATTRNYGDLGSLPDCKVTWTDRTAHVVISSDEGGTDRLEIDTR